MHNQIPIYKLEDNKEKYREKNATLNKFSTLHGKLMIC